MSFEILMPINDSLGICPVCIGVRQLRGFVLVYGCEREREREGKVLGTDKKEDVTLGKTIKDKVSRVT